MKIVAFETFAQCFLAYIGVRGGNALLSLIQHEMQFWRAMNGQWHKRQLFEDVVKRWFIEIS